MNININITEPIYLTLTTIPERLVSDHFRKVYESLNSLYISYTFIILTCQIDEFQYTIPQYLIDDKKVIIHKTNICGPCTKLIGSLDIIPVGSIVIVLDDDIIMRKILFPHYTIHILKILIAYGVLSLKNIKILLKQQDTVDLYLR